MKALLEAIKSQLQDATALSYVSDNSIFITADEYWIPQTISFPAISIKDGTISNQQRLCNNYTQIAHVKISAFQRILKAEQSIIDSQGILQMTQDIIGCLIGENFSLSGLQNAFPVGENESQIFEDFNEMIQKKTIIMEYRLHKTW